GRDFSALVQTLSLTSDFPGVCVELNASSDSDLEGEETFSVLLSGPNYTRAIVIPNQATVAITDLSVVSLTLEKSEYRVTEGEISVRVCANFSESDVIDRTVLATLETLPSDSAMAMTDFVPVVQTLTFNSNVLLCVDVEIYDDSVLEDTETFSITLSSSDPQVIVGAVGVASIIISDDDSVEVSLQGSSYEVDEGLSVLVCVSLSSDVERNVEVTLTTFSDSATATSDYIPLDRVLTFTSDDALCENVTTIEDDTLETAEIFQIALTSSDPNI
ncbi:Extracellular matrix protein FRAS1, partial [Geodia barretti]